MSFRRLSILGIGLLGASLARAVRKTSSDCRIVGYAHRQSTLDAAIAQGVVDEGYADAAQAVRDADVVVMCTPVGAFEDLLRTIGPVLAESTVVTDVGSTKRSVCKLAEGLRFPNQFIGSHPMAGSEKRGLDHADADLYRGALCILTPSTTTNPAAVETAESLWKLVGMRTTRMTADDHDARVALASHLPHAIAAALMTLQTPDTLTVAGKGLADTTRIAAGDAAVWRDIFLDNADNLLSGLTAMERRIAELKTMLERGDGASVHQWLTDAAETRGKFGTRR